VKKPGFDAPLRPGL